MKESAGEKRIPRTSGGVESRSLNAAALIVATCKRRRTFTCGHVRLQMLTFPVATPSARFSAAGVHIPKVIDGVKVQPRKLWAIKGPTEMFSHEKKKRRREEKVRQQGSSDQAQ